MNYDASVRALIQPGRAPTLFRSGGTYTPAALCAEFSRLAYTPFEHDPGCVDQLRIDVSKVGFTILDLVSVADTQVLVLQRDATLVLAFRGTLVQYRKGRLDWTDLRTDADFWHRYWRHQSKELRLAQVLLGEGEARVHSGFAKALECVWPLLQLHIEHLQPQQIWLTGHSLGAALATLAASRLRHHSGVTTYVFGSPRVGNEAFRRLLADAPLYRYVFCADIVCRVPPAFFLDYVHVGEPCYIDRRGRCRNLIPREIRRDRSMAQLSYFFLYGWKLGRNVLFRELADHAPINYAQALLQSS